MTMREVGARMSEHDRDERAWQAAIAGHGDLAESIQRNNQ